MKLQKPINDNYAATVVSVKSIIPLSNCENVVAVPFFGLQAIVSKDTKIGDVGIVFTVETQLSEQFLSENNLYRHSEKNRDKDVKGYFEDKGRVRAVKFRGNTSNCFFIPLESLSYTGVNLEELNVGDTFDHINGLEICRKYVIKVKEVKAVVQKKKSRVDSCHLPEHVSTDNFFKNFDKLNPLDEVYITQKLHGTSIRIGHTFVKHKDTLIDKIAKFFGANIQKYDHDYIYGSRKVIKDPNNQEQNHFYEEDIWTEEGKKLIGLLPKNYIVYGELIGWTPGGKPLQKDYTYGIEKSKCELYVYRIAIVNEDGHITDLTWDQVIHFCKTNGLKFVPEITKCYVKHLTDNDFAMMKNFLDIRYSDSYNQCIGLGDNNLVDEGVCVRRDGFSLNPYILKAKSPLFLEHETKILDTGEEDIESSQNDNT